MRRLALAAPLLFTGCLATLPAATPAAVSSSTLRPEAFFDGRTRSTGTLVVRGQTEEIVRVESRGQAEPNGTFRLDQTIVQEDAAPRTRTWFMAATGGGYRATLTDAHGRVTARTDGPRFRIRYAMNRWGLAMEQTLTLLPGDTLVHNAATVRWLGLPVARLAERIVRLDGPMRR
ncbi:MAG: DUF3833 family protein [Bacteroidetes bacterium]|nr:DUF3833 family protein [Bacteroidota bacterium]